MIYKPSLPGQTINCNNVHFVSGQNPTDEEKSAKDYQVFGHTEAQARRKERSSGKLLRPEASPNKTRIKKQHILHGTGKKGSVFYPFCFCWVPLTTVFLPPIVCPMCKNKTVPHLTKTLSDLRLYADKHTLILMIRSS